MCSGTEELSEPAAGLGGFRSVTHAPKLKATYRYNRDSHSSKAFSIMTLTLTLYCALTLWLCCRVAVDQEEPLALRLLLWLREDVFLGVGASTDGPSQSKMLILGPSEAQGPQPTLEIR